VHLIASVDHVNAPLLWSKREAAKFNWIYQKAVTFAPYAMETANDPQLLASKGEERHVRGAANVLKSLTRNARIIYRIIAEAQIAENGQGLTFPQLFQASRESFLVTAELALRGVLTEFTDHELIRIKKVSDGGEDLITVPMDNNALEQLIEDECEEINNFF
jgi:origin recognition complex subunit 2